MVMTKALPPLAAIRVFEAAARHGNFTKAAEELGMTQAAASYQIKVLEERVGGPLFLRQPGRVELTELGKALALPTTDAFDTLRNAYGALNGEQNTTLSITAVHTFTGQWLARSLGGFQVANPEVAVRLRTSDQIVDFNREEVDLGIRVGLGNWPGVKAEKLLSVTFSPMLSPELANSIGGINEPPDLLKLPLIDAGDRWWAAWFTAAGFADVDLSDRPHSQYGSQVLEANAAMAGQGVAVLSPEYYRQEVAAGRLVQPFELTCRDEMSVWLVYPEARRNVPKIRLFRDWIFAELERTGLLSRPS